MAAPCARLKLVRGPVRKRCRGRPFNGIVRGHLRTVVAKFIQKRSVAEVRAEYPLACGVDGWFFRAAETSNGAWLVEGTDLWGRRVSRRGADPDTLVQECAAEALQIEAAKGAP